LSQPSTEDLVARIFLFFSRVLFWTPSSQAFFGLLVDRRASKYHFKVTIRRSVTKSLNDSVVLAALRENWRALESASERLRDNKEVVKLAVTLKKRSSALKRPRDDEEFAAERKR